MAIVSGPPWALSEDDMVNLLADFHCWLTNPWAADRLEMPALDAGRSFLLTGHGYHGGFTSTGEEGRCDFCTLTIPAGRVRWREEWTGDNLTLCHACYSHQAEVVRLMGVQEYRVRWRDEYDQWGRDGR